MARTLVIAASIVLCFSPTLWARFGAGTPPYGIITLVLSALITALVVAWPRSAEPVGVGRARASAVITLLAASGLVAFGIHRWMQAVLWQPLDPARGDMLAVIEAAIRALLKGRDPYAMYKVPWDAPLPYGPVLWAPFVLPHVLNADLRFVTIAGQAFVPLCCAAVAAVESARGRLRSAAAWLVVLSAIVFNPALMTFATVGHTPSYWPLIPLFAAFVTAERWNAAAVTLALLVTGRTTMISIVPVFAIAVWWKDPEQRVRTLLIFAGTLAALLLPFFLWNPMTMWDGMVASYPRVMKGVVWTSPDGGAVKTIGITGLLLARHLQQFVEVVQALVLGLIYLAAWRFIRSRGAAPFPWMALALFGFSLTTLWPVYYVYFDVLLVLISGAAASTVAADLSSSRITTVWAGLLAGVATAVVVAFSIEAPALPAADLSRDDPRPLYKGFVTTDGELAGSAAIWGTEGTITLPRRWASDAAIMMHVQPVIPADAAPQAVTATLNGTLLGTAVVERGANDIRFDAPASTWRAGSNRLDLQCATSSIPAEVGLGSDGRHLSLGIRRIEVVPR